MTALDSSPQRIALMSAAAGLEASEAAMRRDDADWWHLCREADRKAASRPVDARTYALGACWPPTNAPTTRPCAIRSAPEATIDALVYSLRRGINELTSPDAKRRLSELSEDQLRAVCERLWNFKPEIVPAWTPEEVEALTVIWSELK
jgi:hypothetical protein